MLAPQDIFVAVDNSRALVHPGYDRGFTVGRRFLREAFLERFGVTRASNPPPVSFFFFFFLFRV